MTNLSGEKQSSLSSVAEPSERRRRTCSHFTPNSEIKQANPAQCDHKSMTGAAHREAPHSEGAQLAHGSGCDRRRSPTQNESPQPRLCASWWSGCLERGL